MLWYVQWLAWCFEDHSQPLEAPLIYVNAWYRWLKYKPKPQFSACATQRQAAQCVGRVIRSKADYGMMIFADKRCVLRSCPNSEYFGSGHSSNYQVPVTCWWTIPWCWLNMCTISSTDIIAMTSDQNYHSGYCHICEKLTSTSVQTCLSILLERYFRPIAAVL